MRYLWIAMPVAMVIGSVGCSKSKCESVCEAANECSPCYNKPEQIPANEIPGCVDGSGGIVGRTVQVDCAPFCDDVDKLNTKVKTWGTDCTAEWKGSLDCWQSKLTLICDPGDPNGATDAETDPSGCFAKAAAYTDCMSPYCQQFSDAATNRADAEQALNDDCDATASADCAPTQTECDSSAATACDGVPEDDCAATAHTTCDPYCETVCPANPDDPDDPGVIACRVVCADPCVAPLVETCVAECVTAESDACMAACIEPKMTTCIAVGQPNLPEVPTPDQHCMDGAPTLLPF